MPATWLNMSSVAQLWWQAFFITLSTFSDLNIGSVSLDPIDTWPLYLSVFNFLASRPAILFSEDNSLKPSDFYQAGHWVCLTLLILLSRTLESLLGWCYLRAFALAALAVYSICEWLMTHVTKNTYAFMTRTMRYLNWFWPAFDTEDYDSDLLFLLELVVAYVQLCLPLAVFISGAHNP